MAEDFITSVVTPGSQSAPTPKVRVIHRASSIALWLGRLLCPIGILVTGMVLIEGDVAGSIQVGSITGLLAFMWLIGAIEQRLIDINVTLQRRP